MPVIYCSQLMAAAYGVSVRDAGLDGQLIPGPALAIAAAPARAA